MTEQERENLKRRFDAIAKQLDGTVDMLLSLENENHRLSQTELFTTLLENVKEAEDRARNLADYIDHACDENWKQQL